MHIPRPTSADINRFRAIVPDDPRVEVKPISEAFVARHDDLAWGVHAAE